MTPDQTNHWLILMMALYLSEGWYASWQDRPKHRLHRKARAIVLFDRALNQDIDTLEKKA